MSSLRPQDRKSLCRFSFADGRQCRTPLPPTSTEFAQHVVADLQTGTSVPQPTPKQNQAPTSTSTDQRNPEAIHQ
jgi:hypothetical protein